MTDQTADSLDMIKQDGSTGGSPRNRPSGHPIVRTKDGIVTEGSKVKWDKKAILWALPTTSSRKFCSSRCRYVGQRMGPGILPSMDINCAVSATPLLLIAERFGLRKSLAASPMRWRKTCWMAGGLLWGPIVSDLYSTPVSEGFLALRDMSPLQVNLSRPLWTHRGYAGYSFHFELLLQLHRIQHESLFWWRMHQHITPHQDERYARQNTHPFEHLTLGLGTPMAALMGASDEVFIVSAAFGMWNGKFNHAIFL